MTTIVYGVAGEGAGHSSRAREMITHLQDQGHRVKVVSYDRGYQNLKNDFDVFETEGLHIRSVDNKVSVTKTFVDNIRRLGDGMSKLRQLRHEVFKALSPQMVITDFEPMTAYLANHYDIPLVTIDNQHRMRYMEYPCPDKLRGDARVTETVIRTMVPKPDTCLITTFFFGKVKNERTFLFPPILREEITAHPASEQDHIVVYLTQGFDKVLKLLPSFKRERFLVYGHDTDEQVGNVRYRKFSAEGFVNDLASCKAVIATAGFTLITEALHFGKPYLAFPMQGQFEQELNALLIDELGYGRRARKARTTTVGEFLYRLPEYRDKLSAYPRQDNSAIKAKLDALLTEI